MANSKNLKRVISVTAAALCMMSAFRFTPLSCEKTATAAEALTAFEITEEMKIGWNLGNTLDAFSDEATGVNTETSWGNPKATQELFNALKAKGFNTVRIPITWYQHLDGNNKIDEAWMKRVKEVVDYAYKNDMYVIINVHHENWINRADIGSAYEEMKTRLLAIWTQVATEFKDYDQHLIFECMNEPRAVGTTHEWSGAVPQNELDTINKLDADFVKLIRSIDSPYKDTRLLMIPDYCASTEVGNMSALVVPDDDYVAVSIHAYTPYDFTMNPDVADHSKFTAGYEASLASVLTDIRKTFIEKDIPVIIGEFGASNYNNTEARCAWAEYYIKTTKGMGIPCVLWDNAARENENMAERHDYIDRNNYTWYPDSEQVVDTMMKVLADKNIAWGSEKHGKTYKHDDLSTGTALFNGNSELDASHLGADGKPDKNCMNMDAVWSQLDGKDIAVKFTGDAPAAVAFTDAEWQGWKEVSAYDIDEANGIAYFSAKTAGGVWGEDQLGTIAHLFVRTNGKTTVQQVVTIAATSGDVTPIDKTKKYPIDFTKAINATELVLKFAGQPGNASGCVGYMGEDWINVEWEGTVGSDGKLEIRIPMDKFPAGLQNGEAQIWYDPENLDMVEYEFAGSVVEPPTGTFTGMYGDANQDKVVDIADAVLIMQYLANSEKYQLIGDGLLAADCVDIHGGVTANDALALQMVEAGTISKEQLPVTSEFIQTLVK